jgi:hypothetical protein
MNSFMKIIICLAFLAIYTDIACPKESTAAQPEKAQWGFFSLSSKGSPLAGLDNMKWSRRTGMFWRKLEDPPGSGRYNWKLMDDMVKEAQSGNYNLVFVLKTGNDRRISEPRCFGATSRSWSKDKHLKSCPIKPEYEPHWQRLISNVVERYDGDGKQDMPGLKKSFQLDIQIENEAGSSNFWYFNEKKDGKKAARAYIDLLKLSYEAKQSANPSTKLILAGIIHPEILARCDKQPKLRICSYDYEKRNIDFTKAVLKHPKYYDAIDIHFFNYFKFDPHFIKDGIDWVKEQMRSNGYEKPLYSLEWTGSMMMMIKKGRYLKQFMKHFEYSREIRDQKDAFNIYKDLHLAKYIKYRKWFETEQAIEFPKLFTTMLVNDVKRMIHVRFFDYTGRGWNSIWWNWQGIIRYEGTRLNPKMIKKPSYYTYNILSQKLYGFDSCGVLHYDEDISVYKFNFRDKGPVYIAWTEGQSKIVDLSAITKNPELKISHIVTELDKANHPIHRPDELVSTGSIPVTNIPIVLE